MMPYVWLVGFTVVSFLGCITIQKFLIKPDAFYNSWYFFALRYDLLSTDVLSGWALPTVQLSFQRDWRKHKLGFCVLKCNKLHQFCVVMMGIKKKIISPDIRNSIMSIHETHVRLQTNKIAHFQSLCLLDYIMLKMHWKIINLFINNE